MRAFKTCNSASLIVPFQSEQQAVIKVRRIVYAVFVQDERVGQGTDFEKAMPVGRVPC